MCGTSSGELVFSFRLVINDVSDMPKKYILNYTTIDYKKSPPHAGSKKIHKEY